jgi:SAM-dependent methyltransferase
VGYTCIGHRTALDLLHKSCPPGSLVVDVGTFPGTLTRLLKQHGWKVMALDKEPDRGIMLQHRFHSGASRDTDAVDEMTFAQAMQQIGVEVRSGDVETAPLSIESGTVDAIVLTEVIEHLWVDPLFALTEMNRILKCDTGILLLSTPNLTSIRNRVNFLRGRIGRVIEHPFVAVLKKHRLGHVGHVRLYAPVELEIMLRVLGFEPSFHFYSFVYWDAARTASLGNGNSDHAQSDSVPADSPTPLRRSVICKLFRSPKAYFDAGVATLREYLEWNVPPWRPHMFVLAKKVRNVDFRELSVIEFNSLIRDA